MPYRDDSATLRAKLLELSDENAALERQVQHLRELAAPRSARRFTIAAFLTIWTIGCAVMSIRAWDEVRQARVESLQSRSERDDAREHGAIWRAEALRAQDEVRRQATFLSTLHERCSSLMRSAEGTRVCALFEAATFGLVSARGRTDGGEDGE
jgi:hypothetical protein